MIQNPDNIINPLTGQLPVLAYSYPVWEKVITDFINEFNDFDNEFQYDFIVDNMRMIFENSKIEINRRETWFDFYEKFLRNKIDDYFLDCINSMPFLFETTDDRCVVKLTEEIHLLYQSTYYRFKKH